MARWHRSEAALDAAQAWRDRCWMADGSILSDHQLWTPENLDHLDLYFVQNPDESARGFLEKLHDQLAPTPPEARRLAAEILWILYLSVSDTAMKGATKRLQIRQVWEWSGEPLPNSLMLGTPLDVGFAHPGTGFATNRWREFAFCVGLARAWKAEPWTLRKRWMSDPWEFAAWVDRHPAGTTRQFRHMLLYLLFPEYFERVMTSSHKEQILKRLGSRLGVGAGVDSRDRTAVDQALHELRPKLEDHYGSEVVDYYELPVRGDWIDAPAGGGGSGGGDLLPLEQARAWHRAALDGQRVWLLAPGDGARLWPEFQGDGVAAIGWDNLAQLGQLTSYPAVYEALRELYGGNPTNDANACWQFAHQMQPGDYIIAKQGRSVLLGWGQVTSPYRYDESRPEYRHVHDVKWYTTGRWTLPAEHRMVVKTLTEMTPFPQWLYAAFRVMEGEVVDGWLPGGENDREPARGPITREHHDPRPGGRATPGAGTGTIGGAGTETLQGGAGPVSAPPTVTRPPEPYPLEQALKELFMGQEQFTAILDALARKKNVILEGAPGVGKTFVARRIAWRHLGERDDTRVQMVQFHQSYAYEDFVQGWRPHAGGFGLQDGVFHRFAKKAAGDPGRGYVFIIDEVNRGNLSKIFGELMMLLEADKRGTDHAVPLAYSPGETFYVPENLYLLGMMNTADRSLAMVDYALRRRFSFIRLRPAFEADQFANHLAELGAGDALVQRIVTRMTELNQAIAQDPRMGPGYEIGHSFFVPGDGSDNLDDTWYERVVRQEIEPLLHEYWFGREDQAREHVERLLA
jgi:MoxR-like ATPase